MFRRKAIDHKRFAAVVDFNASEVEKALSRRKEKLSQEWDDLEEGWQDLGEKMAKAGVTKPTDTDDGMVWLNVGGSPAGIHRSGLKRTDGPSTSYTLADLFEADDVTWDKRLPRDSDGRIVLDESPYCLKRILHAPFKHPGEVTRSNDDTTIVDEEPYLVYLCRALRLAEPGVLMVSRGAQVFDADEVSYMVATIQGWLPVQPNELNLLFRATRDGWNSAAFHARCGEDSPSTITLIRVRSPNGRDSSSDSIVGGFSSVPWGGSASGYHDSPGAFLFMLKDDNSDKNKSVPFQPKKWGVKDGVGPGKIYRNQGHGPTFGRGTRREWNDETGGYRTRGGHDLEVVRARHFTKLMVMDDTYDMDSRYVGLNNRPVVEIETFRVFFMVESTALPVLPAERACSATNTAANKMPLFRSPLACAEEHRNDINKFGELIAEALMEERMALLEARSELVEAGAKASAWVNALAAVYGPHVAAGKEDPVVELSVRGSRVTTLLSTLQACPESFLATKFNEDRWPATDKDVDEHGRRLIDCSPCVFTKVLDVLRMRKRATWAGTASEKGRDDWRVRVIIKAEDRGEFDKFVEKHFPGDFQSFIMDYVEPSPESGGR